MIKRLLLGLVLSWVMLLAMFGCGSENKEKLTVGYIPIAECAPLYVAQELNLFEKHGVEVDFVSLAGGAVILTALRGNSIDVGFTNVVSLVIQRTNGAKFKSVYGATYETESNQNHAFLRIKGNEVVSDSTFFANATIGVNTRKNIEELMVRKFLDSRGMGEMDDSQFIEIAFPQMLPILESGKVDAISIVEPFITIAGNSNKNIEKVCNHYLATRTRTLVATYVSSENVIRDKSKALKNFTSAMKEATDYMNSNEGETRNIIGNYTKIPSELLMSVGLSEFSDAIAPEEFDPIIKDIDYYGFLNGKKAPSIKDMIWENE